MKKRDILTIWDLSAPEIEGLIKRAVALKGGADKNKCPLIGKSIGLLFEKSSTRTRVSFEAGVYQLGGQPVFLNSNEIQLGRGETVADTARTLSLYLSAVAIRTFGHDRLLEFSSNARVPVINALTDKHHPCQALADIMTVYEKRGGFKGVRLAYVGDGNNVANSLIEAASRMSMDITLACPEGYEPDAEILERARESAKSEIVILRDPREAVGRADVVYTDVWISMGREKEAEERMKKFKSYQINSDLMKCARPGAIVMHCLPAHRGEEISAEVMDGPMSVVFDQAENRLHVQKALLEFLLG